MMVYPESQGLQGKDDNDGDETDSEESGNSCHSELPSPLFKRSDSTDDNQTEDLGEPTPFSVISGHSYMVKNKKMGLDKRALKLEVEDQEFQEPLYKDTGMSDNSAGDEEPSTTHRLPGHQRLPAPQKAGTAPSGFHNPFQHSSGQHLGTEAAATQACASDHYVGHPESTGGAEPHVLHEEDSEDRESPSLQPTYNSLWQDNSSLRSENEMLRNVNLVLMSENFALKQAFGELKKGGPALRERDVTLRQEYNMLREQYDRLQGENAALRKDNAETRRMFNTFQNNLNKQACMVASLQDQLEISQAEREREAQEAQCLVQQTETRLQLINQRALDAETNVERLKQKIYILQGQLERCKLENEHLRTDWPGSSRTQVSFHQARPPQAHNEQRWLRQAVPASGVLPVVAEVLESTRKILKF
ncbi:endosome-associated-trafficking regulator 1-like [Catharus ustulatus]|uniref:endosome-associated-trafficking regulator 1-like n=1 Tax=Catharus ustulatus TaxID=91951 RepID=UPI00140AE50E|nr:endosome-associated-trafficking regulator 1-like [Catharus ustulatus]